MKKFFNILFIFLSILACLGGAVNSGFTGFWLATPYAVFLLHAAKKNIAFLIALALFLIACICIQQTQDKNPLLYPLLNKEIHVTNGCGWVITGGIHAADNEDYDVYMSPGRDLCAEVGGTKFNKFPVKEGRYKVVGVHHSYADMGNNSYYIVDINAKRVLLAEGQAQAPWAHLLSILPVFPLFIFIVFPQLFSHSF